MKKKVLKKAQKGIQVSDPTFPAGPSRFMDAPAKPKPAPAPAKKETKEKSKKSTNTYPQSAKGAVAYYPAPKNLSNPYKKIEYIDPYKDKRKLMGYGETMTAMHQKELNDYRASIKKKKGGAIKKKK